MKESERKKWAMMAKEKWDFESLEIRNYQIDSRDMLIMEFEFSDWRLSRIEKIFKWIKGEFIEYGIDQFTIDLRYSNMMYGEIIVVAEIEKEA